MLAGDLRQEITQPESVMYAMMNYHWNGVWQNITREYIWRRSRLYILWYYIAEVIGLLYEVGAW